MIGNLLRQAYGRHPRATGYVVLEDNGGNCLGGNDAEPPDPTRRALRKFPLCFWHVPIFQGPVEYQPMDCETGFFRPILPL